MRKYQEERLQAILRAARGSAYYCGLLPREDLRAPGSPFEVLAQLPCSRRASSVSVLKIS